ncbi:MAG TPA: 2,3,4,5-tetrahydropyridine-2,6-dicarboxylate N-succinyltransferase [Vicinamibacteria bacterium]|nr:2,3,4,5-tetrahydropyridine-2,6-dicarboxylate N-succinyltransferase [Vicinamibacteria bacterium]
MTARPSLQQEIESAFELPAERLGSEARASFDRFLGALERGEVRAAEPMSGGWQVNAWVKKGILLGFRLGRVVAAEDAGPLRFFDKDTFLPRRLALADKVRVVPGGTAIRSGAHVAPGVVLMPPSYVNVGAYLGEGTMVDSHALVGSCAQIGQHVHLSAAAQIGGVLEPVGALPVIIEDEVLVGGNCGVYEGTIVGRRAVLGAGVILTGGITVYDVVKGCTYRRTPGAPLRIPEGAVVVPGSRRLGGEFAESHGLSLAAPVIVKYRDQKTDASAALEDALR